MNDQVPSAWIPQSRGGIAVFTLAMVFCFMAGMVSPPGKGGVVDGFFTVAVWWFIIAVVRYFSVVATYKKAKGL
jgi:hypothetical protein